MMRSRLSCRRCNPPQTEEQQPFFSKPRPPVLQPKEETPFFQPKLTIGEPSDKYEQEADAMADAVVGGQNRPSVQRRAISGIQRYVTNAEEDELGTNNRSLRVQAFTHGEDLYFNAGKYSPESGWGKDLLAHELTQVVQQGAAEIRRNDEDAAKTPAAPAKAPTVEAEKKKVKVEHVSLSVSWGGVFDGDTVNPPDKSATVVVYKVRGKGKKGKELQRISGAGSAALTVAKHPKYYIEVIPTATQPGDRYTRSARVVSYAGPEEAESSTGNLSASVGLAANRWNLQNVEYTWRAKRIDAAKAAKVKKTEIFGQKVWLNELVHPRAKRTDDAFKALPAAVQTEIKDSIAIFGGYAKRTTSKGGFSNHSLGTAIDMNYNLSMKQNPHLFKKEKADAALLAFAQEVVRRRAGKLAFDIWAATGESQRESSDIFNEEFSAYVRELMNEAIPSPAAARAATPAAAAGQSAVAQAQAAGTTQSVFQQYSTSAIKKGIQAAEKAKKPDLAGKLTKVESYWSLAKAWIEGTKVKGVVLKGMIPIHKQLLKLMLDNGWEWGGDWSSAKDYMHFEDTAALSQLQQSPPPASAPPAAPAKENP